MTHVVLAILTALAPWASAAEEMPVPIETQVPILIKILFFDRQLSEPKGKALVVGVLHQSGFRASVTVKDRFVEAVARDQASFPTSRPIQVVSVDADTEKSLEKVLQSRSIEALYVTPTRALDLRVVVAATRRSRVLSLTGMPGYLEAGLSIGLSLKGGRPQILVNLEAAKAEGADLPAPFLSLATVIRTRNEGP